MSGSTVFDGQMADPGGICVWLWTGDRMGGLRCRTPSLRRNLES